MSKPLTTKMNCPFNISVSAENFSSRQKGFRVETDDGQEGIITYREIADVALKGRLADQSKPQNQKDVNERGEKQ